MRLATVTTVLLIAACGYQTGQISAGGGRTLAIPMFANQTFRRDLERDLTRFVREEAEARTDYVVVDSRAADVRIEGRLADVEEDVLSDRSRGRIRESSVAFVVYITITDRETGETLVENERIVERAAFVPVKGESIRTAELLVMRRIAERVVYSLSSEW
jgi:hypothetical protein